MGSGPATAATAGCRPPGGDHGPESVQIDGLSWRASSPSGRCAAGDYRARMSTLARTFPELLADRLHADPGQPLVTAYDDTTGERTELSVTTYVNWVSKTANLFTDELGCDAGDTVLLDLPSHWLVPVFLGAAWSAALAVDDRPRGRARRRRVRTGPSVSATSDADQVVACSLLPFAVRFADPLPAGVLDYGVLWPGQSDVFVGLDAAEPRTPPRG